MLQKLTTSTNLRDSVSNVYWFLEEIPISISLLLRSLSPEGSLTLAQAAELELQLLQITASFTNTQ